MKRLLLTLLCFGSLDAVAMPHFVNSAQPMKKYEEAEAFCKSIQGRPLSPTEAIQYFRQSTAALSTKMQLLGLHCGSKRFPTNPLLNDPSLSFWLQRKNYGLAIYVLGSSGTAAVPYILTNMDQILDVHNVTEDGCESYGSTVTDRQRDQYPLAQARKQIHALCFVP